MNELKLKVIALAVGCVVSAGALAQSLAKDDYQAGKAQIAAEVKAGKAACASLSGNPNDICVAEAKGREKIARAELEASYKPTPKTHYLARIAKAEADYAVANERCDDLAGNTKDVCVKEAKAAETMAKADAKAQMKTTDANLTANDKTTAARKDATVDKLDAQYGVAKEKCDTFAGDAKAHCMDQAKARFGKT